jgi:hypothetical protein
MLAWMDHTSVADFYNIVEAELRIKAYKELNISTTEYISHSRGDALARSYSYRTNEAIAGLQTHNEFFTALKQHQPLKYQKACKEFTKAVGL